MKAVVRIVCTVACGFVLAVALSDQTTWAGDETRVSRSAQRIGGQAGQPYDHPKPAQAQPEEGVEGQAGARIGGQAGRPYDHVKHEYAPAQTEERIGGQAGQPYDHPNPPQVQPEEGVEGQAGAQIGG